MGGEVEGGVVVGGRQRGSWEAQRPLSKPSGCNRFCPKRELFVERVAKGFSSSVVKGAARARVVVAPRSCRRSFCNRGTPLWVLTFYLFIKKTKGEFFLNVANGESIYRETLTLFVCWLNVSLKKKTQILS